MTIYITTRPVKHSPNGWDVEPWPVGTEVAGVVGESLHRQGKARIKPGRKPASTKPAAPEATK
jgi:hypothetical protein